MTEEAAKNFAQEWIESWNNHDLDRILSHYADSIRFTSPFVQKLLGQRDGVVQGIEALRHYFGNALEAYPELRFELYTVFSGVNSVTVHYRSVKNLLAAEVMIFDDEGKISSVTAHYATDTEGGTRKWVEPSLI